MPANTHGILQRTQDGLRRRIIGVFVVLVAANVAGWLWTAIALTGQPLLLGMALLAYSLGLRHGLDADHIATIDNVTRKLVHEGEQPVTVGLFFALGHSAVVLLASVAVAAAAKSFADEFAYYREIGGLIGTTASALFLFSIATANLTVLICIYRTLLKVKKGEEVLDDDIDALLLQRGWLARLLRPFFRLISKDWHLFPIGFLFALGFESASEISLFGLSAGASKDVSIWSVFIFPTLFAAGMTLVDTADGILMLGAYGWANQDPVRKLIYNLTITSISVLVAVVIGGIEALYLLAGHYSFEGKFWQLIVNLNGNFGKVGYGVVALFIVSWLISVAVYRAHGLDQSTHK